MNNKNVFSFLIYSCGLGCLFFADLIVSNAFPRHTIADWALFRSLVGISAVLPLTGLDQVLVRSPQSSARLMRRLALQVPMVGLLVGLILDITDILDHWALGAGLAIGSALSLMFFHYFRSHHRRVLAQLAQQGWKIGALCLLAYLIATDMNADLILCGVILLLIADVVVGVFVLRHTPATLMIQTPEPMSALYAIGLRFMVTALFLSLSVYAEQVVVNRLGSIEDAALYFTSATYFLFPMSFLNGYAAFVIGPWVRDNEEKFISDFWSKRFQLIMGIMIYALALSGIGWIAWVASSPSVGRPDHILQLLIMIMCAFRTLYLFPSGYIGVFGRPKEHDILILAQVVALTIVVLVFIGLLSNELDLIYAVALSSSLNWGLRCAAAYLVMLLIARKRGWVSHD